MFLRAFWCWLTGGHVFKHVRGTYNLGECQRCGWVGWEE